MCLGVPGKVIEIQENPVGMTMGRVSFGGIVKEVCLAYTPGVDVGDYVVVHVGFAISTIDEDEANKVFEFLREMDELGELDVPQPGDGVSGSTSGSGVAGGGVS
ncbi:MAG: HypC/HybG/HupF family hydrogenase formation chaperone [Acidobacteriota bacterium]|nr:HypC/HybG/HupF family hydrogenase formation chaperone [Acidobacteriota bacterium]